MKELEGKLPEKEPIDTALAELKAAHAAKDIAGCDAAQEKLNAALQAASAEIQAAMQGNDQQGGDDQGPDAGGDANATDDVTDVDFEEVKDYYSALTSPVLKARGLFCYIQAFIKKQ